MRDLLKTRRALVRGTTALVASFAILLQGEARAAVSFTEDAASIHVTNGRVTFDVAKPGGKGHDVGSVSSLTLDGQEMLNEGYFDTHDVAGYFRLGHHDVAATTYEVRKGVADAAHGFVDVVVHHSPSSLQPLDIKQHYILRDGEACLHLFTEVNHSAAQKDDPFGEMRSVFMGDPKRFTFLSTDDNVSAPLPRNSDLNAGNTVQDTTWDLGAYPQDPYVVATGKRYYTKYDFCGFEQDHTVHGFWGPSGYGLWLVQVSKDTLTGGPTRYDLMEHHGPALLNMLISGHFGSKAPHVQGDWHRTYGPFLLLVNKTPTLATARADAKKYATPSFDRAFYDALAIPGYATTAQRGALTGRLAIKASAPTSAAGAVAVLDSPGTDFQRAVRADSFQYWTRVAADGRFAFHGVRAGAYRLTIYRTGIFGEYANDAIKVAAAKTARLGILTWTPPTHGTEIWRIGTPDRTAREFRHGNEYRYYWGGYDFDKDFPAGVHYVIGKSKPSVDWNYTQWGAWPPFSKTAPHAADWNVEFSLPAAPPAGGTATLTVGLASIINAHHDASLVVSVNGEGAGHQFDWSVPADDNGQSAIRSGILSFYVSHEYVFPAALLHSGTNHIAFHLPHNGENLQYDALRLEVQRTKP